MYTIDPNKLTLRRKYNDHILPRHKRGGRFLKGPIPFNWLAIAARQPGKTLHVAIGLWHLAFMQNNHTVALSNKILESLGVDRFSKARSIKFLEQVGLISVEQHHGRSPRITILDVNDCKEVIHQ